MTLLQKLIMLDQRLSGRVPAPIKLQPSEKEKACGAILKENARTHTGRMAQPGG